MLLVLAFTMKLQEKEEALWVLGEKGKEVRSSCAFTGLKLSIVTASQVTQDLEIFLKIEFWRLTRGAWMEGVCRYCYLALFNTVVL